MENNEINEPQVKNEEPISEDRQPQEIIVEEIQHGIPTQEHQTPPLPSQTVITTPRHRMITTAGHIRLAINKIHSIKFRQQFIV